MRAKQHQIAVKNARVVARTVLAEVFAMSKLRLKYGRDDSVKYVSHLDFMRMMTRAIRRAGLPLSYSQGFNPHPIMTVAVPLSVGMSSEGEYMEISFDEEFIDLDELKDRINRALPSGFFVLEIKDPLQAKLDGLKYIDTGEYRVSALCSQMKPGFESEFMALENIMLEKKTKSGMKDTDIRPMIHELSIQNMEGQVVTFYMKLAAGAVNLKPQLVVEALNRYANEFSGEFLSSHRIALLATGKNCF
jgi:radical SAM-linked protein